jgi:hypothetical protein
MSATREAKETRPATSQEALGPLSIQRAPAIIERLLPVQKLCVESYREQMAGQAKLLTALGSYWKGRKPLILSKACVLGSLLPSTDDQKKDLEVFELLMGMDNEAMAERFGFTTPRWVAENVEGLSYSRLLRVRTRSSCTQNSRPLSSRDSRRRRPSASNCLAT